MKDLIQNLKNPYFNNKGEIVEANIYMRQAASTLEQLLPVMESDRLGRLRAEQKEREVLAELIKLRDQELARLEAVDVYKNVVNREQELAFS